MSQGRLLYVMDVSKTSFVRYESLKEVFCRFWMFKRRLLHVCLSQRGPESHLALGRSSFEGKCQDTSTLRIKDKKCIGKTIIHGKRRKGGWDRSCQQ